MLVKFVIIAVVLTPCSNAVDPNGEKIAMFTQHKIFQHRSPPVFRMLSILLYIQTLNLLLLNLHNKYSRIYEFNLIKLTLKFQHEVLKYKTKCTWVGIGSFPLHMSIYRQIALYILHNNILYIFLFMQIYFIVVYLYFNFTIIRNVDINHHSKTKCHLIV